MIEPAQEDDARGERATIGAVIAGAGAYVFCVSPILRYVDVEKLAWFAAFLGLSAFATWAVTIAWPKRILFTLTLSAVVSAVGGISILVNDAREAAAANDRRCLAIQRDMLSARPRRSDSPDLFQALGCRPQGQGSVFALPRSTLERSAAR